MPINCDKKSRVCGGGKDGRGCGKNHNVHELFCPEAKVLSMEVSMSAKLPSNNVVLSIMNVRIPKKRIQASVFWDLGCTSNFIRQEFAEMCGFKGHSEKLSVTTLGGVVTDYKTVTKYDCAILDENGNAESFEAYGIESITGKVSRIDSGVLKRLFPHLSDRVHSSLLRSGDVDILIGISHPSWHPERAEKAQGTGDLWIFRGRFGACVGGRHSDIVEGTQICDSLFAVNHAFFVQSSFTEGKPSHNLEFCSSRVQLEQGPFFVGLTKTAPLDAERPFLEGEDMGICIEPKCGGCKCSKCPVPGSKYSFKEQQEYDTISGNLRYDTDQKRWYTEYP